MKTLSGLNTVNISTTRVTYSKIAGVGVSTGAMILALLVPTLAFGSVEGSLAAIQDKLVGTILPLAAICGLIMAGFSFVAGHANARQHLVYAIIGAAVGFGAESIVSLIRGLVH